MMAFTRWLGALAVAGALTFTAGAVSAEPASAGSLQLGVGFRYGWELDEDTSGPNPWAAGIGVNGGVTLPLVPIYLGGVAEYFFGETVDGVSTLPGGAVPTRLGAKLWQVQAEGGYDIGLGPIFVLRPKLGLGYAHTSFDRDGLVPDSSRSSFVIAPGLTGLFVLPVVNVQVDVRYDMHFSEPRDRGLILSAGLGF